MAIKLSGNEKIRLLGSIQSKWASISGEVKKGDEVVISSANAQATALNKIKQIGDDIEATRAERHASIEDAGAAWAKVADEASSALDRIKQDATALFEELESEKKVDLDADQALKSIGNIREKLDSIFPNGVAHKKVIIETYTKSSPVRPFTEGISYMQDKLNSLSGSGDYTMVLCND